MNPPGSRGGAAKDAKEAKGGLPTRRDRTVGEPERAPFRNQRSTISGSPRSFPRYIIATSLRLVFQTSRFYRHGFADCVDGIRTERYPYARIANHPAELFDRKSGPDQRHNVAGNPENKGIIEKPEAALEKQIREVAIAPYELPGAAGSRKGERRSVK